MLTRFINFDNFYDPTRVITNPNPLNNKDKTFTDDGVFSPRLFGQKNESKALSWQCECGKYKGKFLDGYVCEECKTKVKFTESYLDKLAWIDLEDLYVINPIFYYQIAKLCGGVKNFNKIINFESKIDRDGEVITDDKKMKYESIGLIKFKEDFNNIIIDLHKMSKNAEKDKILMVILQNKDKIFINHIPVFDTQLRPATVTFKDKPIFKFDEINNNYNFILELKNLIKKENSDFDLVVLPNLYNIQCKINIIFNKIIDNLAGKTGFIRSNAIGNRLNFSARNVITPLKPGYQINEIVVPYLTFVELYSFHLINMLSKIKKINLIEAQKIIIEAEACFNDEVYNLCKELIKKTVLGCCVFAIRNPTISRGSIQTFKIANVKKDINDLTTSVHNSILELFAGDYDGDVINLFPIMDNELKELAYKIFSPDSMFISNNDGKFNTKLALDRDQVIGLNQFNKQAI